MTSKEFRLLLEFIVKLLEDGKVDDVIAMLKKTISEND